MTKGTNDDRRNRPPDRGGENIDGPPSEYRSALADAAALWLGENRATISCGSQAEVAVQRFTTWLASISNVTTRPIGERFGSGEEIHGVDPT